MAFLDASGKEVLSTGQEELLTRHPKDIRTARKYFDLEGKVLIYTACPRCSYIYPPVLEEDQDMAPYPESCTYNPLPADPNSGICGEPLLHRIHPNGRLQPIRPLGFRDPKDWIATLLARPGMEALLDSSWNFMRHNDYHDIFDADFIQNFKGPSGQYFHISGDEGHYIFALSVDWFNPYSNKAAGITASVGAISLACLNIPSLIRYKWENIYVAGIIPGPREPSLEEVDHFMKPLIEGFLELWDPGVFFNRTANFPSGKVIRCAIIPFVADTVGSRKTVGSPRCILCGLIHEEVRKGEMINPEGWERLSSQQYRGIAQEWLQAETFTKRNKIYKEKGIRWSPLLLLPYWDPLQLAIVDPMHVLFLNVVKNHFRKIYKVDSEGANKKELASHPRRPKKSKIKPLNEEDIEKGLSKLSKPNLKLKSLKNLKYSTLEELCRLHGIKRTVVEVFKFTKASMAQDLYLWVSAYKALYTSATNRKPRKAMANNHLQFPLKSQRQYKQT